jgi:antitoxin (DNA-binding transcriptional repressor) of toxin-antitoxin stability system
VAGGEQFIITRRGTPVAELRPLETPGELADVLEECRTLRGKSSGVLDTVALVRQDRSR